MTPPPPARLPQNTILHSDDIAILYIVLLHGHAKFAIRLINALYEKNHTFVIHVDLKAQSVFNEMSTFAATKENIYMLQNGRQDAVWGGFSIVNATLAAMNFGMNLGRRFDYMIDISGTSYPIKSNRAIRMQLAEKPNAVYMDVQDQPNRPSHDLWYHYVECDGNLHRIGRLPLLRGINMHIGSQWFAIPKHVMTWYLEDPLPKQYIFYCQHVVVADENYFSTLFKNSPYCGDLVPKNLLFLLFDKYENEKLTPEAFETASDNIVVEDKLIQTTAHIGAGRDKSKCLGPDPDHCGRSPTTLVMSYKKLLEVSRALFARKFDPNNTSSMELVDIIDKWRLRDEDGGRRKVGDEGNEIMVLQTQGNHSSQEGGSDLCWELTHPGGRLIMKACNPMEKWQWFRIGPCTDNAAIFIEEDSFCQKPHEDESEMFCQLQSAADDDVCVDIDGENIQPGSHMIGWACSGQWNQLFRLSSNCSISAVQPEIVSRIRGFDDRNITRCLQSNLDPYTSVFLVETAECTNIGSNSTSSSTKQRFQLLKRNNHLITLFHDKKKKIANINTPSPPSPASAATSSLPTPLQFLMATLCKYSFSSGDNCSKSSYLGIPLPNMVRNMPPRLGDTLVDLNLDK